MVKPVRRWANKAKLALQNCFDCTGWSVYEATATDKLIKNLMHIQQQQTMVYC